MKKCGGIPPAPKWVTFFFNPPQPSKTQHLGALKNGGGGGGGGFWHSKNLGLNIWEVKIFRGSYNLVRFFFGGGGSNFCK